MTISQRVEKELQLITGIQKKDDEVDIEYWKRLLYSVADIPDKKFNAMSGHAKLWYQISARAHENDRPCYPFFILDNKDWVEKSMPALERPEEMSWPDRDAIAATTEADKAKEPTEGEKVKKKKAKKEPKQEKRPAAKKEPKKEGAKTARREIIRLVCKNRNISDEDICAKLEKASIKFSASNVKAIAYMARLVLEIENEKAS